MSMSLNSNMSTQGWVLISKKDVTKLAIIAATGREVKFGMQKWNINEK